MLKNPTRKRSKSVRQRVAVVFLLFFTGGFLLPENYTIPVKDATRADWNRRSFWFYPWGKSVVHKGIDIFAPEGRPVLSATGGLVVWTGTLKQGGKSVVVLGPKWRFHYYTHLRDYRTGWFRFARSGTPIAEVGTTGNAAGKAPHLHYAVFTLVPYPWRWDDSVQGWKKMFYLNPDELLP